MSSFPLGAGYLGLGLLNQDPAENPVTAHAGTVARKDSLGTSTAPPCHCWGRSRYDTNVQVGLTVRVGRNDYVPLPMFNTLLARTVPPDLLKPSTTFDSG